MLPAAPEPAPAWHRQFWRVSGPPAGIAIRLEMPRSARVWMSENW
jgi:hypothetical protein